MYVYFTKTGLLTRVSAHAANDLITTLVMSGIWQLVPRSLLLVFVGWERTSNTSQLGNAEGDAGLHKVIGV